MRCASPPLSVVAGWPEADVAEPDVYQRVQLVANAGDVLEQARGLRNRHVEDVCDRLAPERDFQRLTVVAGAEAHLARHGHVRQELHLYLNVSGAGARLAPPPLTLKENRPGL